MALARDAIHCILLVVDVRAVGRSDASAIPRHVEVVGFRQSVADAIEIQVLTDAAERTLHRGIINHPAGSGGDTYCGTDSGTHAAALGDGSTVFLRSDAVMAQAGKVSMPGVMEHEFMQITWSRIIRDDAYGCDGHRFNLSKPFVKENLESSAPGANLFTADAYRCWVGSASIGSPLGSFASKSPNPRPR